MVLFLEILFHRIDTKTKKNYTIIKLLYHILKPNKNIIFVVGVQIPINNISIINKKFSFKTMKFF